MCALIRLVEDSLYIIMGTCFTCWSMAPLKGVKIQRSGKIVKIYNLLGTKIISRKDTKMGGSPLLCILLWMLNLWVFNLVENIFIDILRMPAALIIILVEYKYMFCVLKMYYILTRWNVVCWQEKFSSGMSVALWVR